VKIAVTRSGGFAGLVQRAAIDTADLPDAAEWQELADQIDLAALPPPRREPDRYVYEIDIDGQTAEIGESALTGPLRDLVDKVMGRAA
jgi:hypothetical protein